MNFNNKKVLFLQIYGGGKISGGTEVYLKNLLKELNKIKNKNELFVATFNSKNSIFSQYALVSDSFFTRFLENWEVINYIYRFYFLGLFSYIWGIYWLYRLSCKIINKHKIKVIYSNGGLLTAIVAYFLSRKNNIPYVLHFHGLFNLKDLISGKQALRSFLLSNIIKKAIVSSTKIIANSREVADDINIIKGLNYKIEVIHCFVDTDLYHPQNKTLCRKHLKINNNSFVFLSPNRLEENKGVDFLLESIPLIKKNNIVFIFIGDGYLKLKLKQLAEKDKRVIYLPPIPNNEIPEYINSADIVWGPASVHYIGLSLVESLACGKPIIALNTPLPVDNNYGRYVDKKTIPRTIGFLIKKKSNNFAHLIETLSSKKIVLAQMKKKCISFYLKNYGNNNKTRIIEIIYNIAIKNSNN